MRAWINQNPMTFLLYCVFVIVAAVGGVITIIQPATLDFNEYLNKLVIFAGAVGVLGAGKAIKNGLKGDPPQEDAGLPPVAEPPVGQVGEGKEFPARKPTTTRTRKR